MTDYAQMSVPRDYRDQAKRLREELVRLKARGKPLPPQLERFLSGAECPYCGNTDVEIPRGMSPFAICGACQGKWHVAKDGQTDLDGILKAVGMVALVGLGLWLISELTRQESA